MVEGPIKPPKREFPVVSDAGTESTVFGYVKDSEEQPWVIKKLDKITGSDEGIEDYKVNSLRHRYRWLVEQYGDVIVKQRIMPRSEFTTPDDEPTKWFIMQERLQLAEPADVFDYAPGQLPEAVIPTLHKLVADEKREYTRFDKHYNDFSPNRPRLTSVPLPLDLGLGNLLLTKTGEVKYVDTSAGIPDFRALDSMGTTVYEVHNRLAMLELLAGKSPAEVLQDPFNKPLVRILQIERLIDKDMAVASAIGPAELKRALDSMWYNNPTRQGQFEENNLGFFAKYKK